MYVVTYKGAAKRIPLGGQQTSEDRQAATDDAIDTAVETAISRMRTHAGSLRRRITVAAVPGEQAFTVTAVRRTTLEALPKSVKGFRARKIRKS